MIMADVAAGSGGAFKEYMTLLTGGIGTIFGGALLKYIDNRYSARSKRTDIDIKLHDEARDEIKDMKARLDQMDTMLRNKDKIYTRTLIKYNVLRERYNLPFDLDDSEMEKHVSSMMDRIDTKKVEGETTK